MSKLTKTSICSIALALTAAGLFFVPATNAQTVPNTYGPTYGYPGRSAYQPTSTNSDIKDLPRTGPATSVAITGTNTVEITDVNQLPRTGPREVILFSAFLTLLVGMQLKKFGKVSTLNMDPSTLWQSRQLKK
jgi:hypothetical protein